MGNFFSSTGTASQNSKASELPDLPAQAIPIIDEAYNIQTEVESTIDRLVAVMETSRSDEHQPTISVETLNKKLPKLSKEKMDTKATKKTLMVLADCTCPICLEILIEPVSFTCSHEICLSCLTCLMKTNEYSTCPICREEISLEPAVYKQRYEELCPKCFAPFHVYCPVTKKLLPKKYLVNTARWRRIKIQFQEEIADRLNGKTAIKLAETIRVEKETAASTSQDSEAPSTAVRTAIKRSCKLPIDYKLYNKKPRVLF